ncbi:MAG: hypothetical protein A3F68_06775 [Acidobacteria bacterium RIFCSPLOWO2_12_FULL_54_10]|nr:MAG: hypothetical protein A3F68_06775 [Acidobacteria bacterium RIFCSPLOWO2_12_FULL_54_10]
MTDIRLVVFDLDGTLIDSKTDLVLSVNATLENLGRKTLDTETISSYVGQGSQVLIQKALGMGCTPEEVAMSLEFFMGHYREHKLDNTVLYEGVRETLKHLAKGNHRGERALAVLTNKPERVSREIIQELDLMTLFRCVYGGNSFEKKKPDPAGLRTILDETGVAPAEAMIVGDSDIDVRTGVAAGTRTCGVTYGFGKLDLDANPPDVLVSSFGELVAVIEQDGTA